MKEPNDQYEEVLISKMMMPDYSNCTRFSSVSAFCSMAQGEQKFQYHVRPVKQMLLLSYEKKKSDSITVNYGRHCFR